MTNTTSSPTIKTLPFLFDRPRSQHPWSAGLSGMADEPAYGHGAIAANWRMDHRVSGPREQQLLVASRFSGQTDPALWWGERLAYFQQSLCLPSITGPSSRHSAYLDDQNAVNAIPPGTLPHHERLIHVASLNSMLWRLSGGSYITIDLDEWLFDLTALSLPSRGIGTAAPGLAGFDTQVESIAEALNQLEPDAVQQFARHLCEALGDTQPPWWACFAQEVMPLVNAEDWTGLCRGLGLGHLNAGDHLLIWNYPVSATGPLFRPTVIEANDSPYHHPSLPSHKFGITMPLNTAQAGAWREVVHGPLSGSASKEFCTGRLAKIAQAPMLDHNQLNSLRNRQQQRLSEESTHQRDENWLQRHA
jgi:hypothetical protein